MRLAVLIHPSGPKLEGAATRGDAAVYAEASAWLSGACVRLGFEVVVAFAGEGASSLDDALARVGPGDELLVHVMGRVEPDASLVLGADPSLSLAALRDAIVERDVEDVFVLAEVSHGDNGVGRIVDALDPSAGGHALIVATHHASAVDPLAFARRAVAVATELVRGEGVARLSRILEALPPVHDGATAEPSYVAVPGARDFELAVALDALDDTPSVEALLALADGARDRGAWERALAGYKAALPAASGDAEIRADVLARIGAVERARGRARIARRAFARALASSPLHLPSLDALIAIASEDGEWSRVVELSRRRVSVIESPAERADELFAIAQILVEHLHDLPAAVIELERARQLEPTRDDLLEALRRAYKVLSRWPELLGVTGALAARAATGAERAARRFTQARILLDHMHDEDGALALLETSLDDDPTHDEALEVLIGLRGARGELGEIDRMLSRLVTRLDELGEAERAGEVARRLAALLQGELDTGAPGDVAPIAQSPVVVEVEPDVDDDDETALAALEADAARSPLDASVHARLYAVHESADRVDAAYLAALALEELGAVEPRHQALLDQRRPDRPRLRAALDESAWRALRAPGSDDVVESLLASVARAAIAASLAERHARNKLRSLDGARRLPETSTASIVRCFHWAAHVLDVECPALYTADDVPAGVEAVPVLEPSTTMSPRAIAGLLPNDLAFLVGRHLTYYRPEYAVLVHYPTLSELTVLALAAVKLALPTVEVPPAVAPVVDALAERLTQHLSVPEHAKMTRAVRRLDSRGGKIGLPTWMRSAELTAARVGLFMCGDLRAAMQRVRAEARSAAGLGFDERRADLVAFCVSPAHARLRAELRATGSTPPPPQSGEVRAHDGGAASFSGAPRSVEWGTAV